MREVPDRLVANPAVRSVGAAQHSYWEPLEFIVPDPLRDLSWRVEIDPEHPDTAGRAVDPSTPVTLTGRSLLLLHATQLAS